MNLFVLKTWLEAKMNKDEDGASLVEYILLVALIALAVIAAVIFLRNQVSDKFSEAGSKLSTNGRVNDRESRGRAGRERPRDLTHF